MKPEDDLYQRIWSKKSSGGSESVDPGSRVDIALKLLERGDRFLDIGCGKGTLCRLVKGSYTDIYGVDISQNALNIAKTYNIKTKKINLNEEKLPFEDGYFDSIACLDIIEHIFDPIGLVNEIERVLRSGGTLVISAPNIRYWRHLFILIIKGRFPSTSDETEHYDGGHLHYFTYKDLEQILINCRFDVVQRMGVFGSDIFKEILSPGIVIKAIRR